LDKSPAALIDIEKEKIVKPSPSAGKSKLLVPSLLDMGQEHIYHGYLPARRSTGLAQL